MPPSLNRSDLQRLSRAALQALCKDYGVRANLKSEALIDLLLDTAKPNPRISADPTARNRSVSVRHSSRSTTGRTSSMIIHDIDSEEEDVESPPNTGLENHPEVEPVPPPPPQHRTRKAKETQTRLGVGKPAAAGGSGPRAVTKSISKPKRGKSSSVKPMQETILEEDDTAVEGNTPQAEHFVMQGANAQTTLPLSSDPNASFYEQMQNLKAELDTMRLMRGELDQLKAQVSELRTLQSQVDNLTTELQELRSRVTSSPSAITVSPTADTNQPPRLGSPVMMKPSAAPRSSSGSKHPGFAPVLLGKRTRDSTASDITGVVDKEDSEQMSQDALSKQVVRPGKKRARRNNEEEDPGEPTPEEDTSQADVSMRTPPGQSRFTVFTGPELPPPNNTLPSLYTSADAGPSNAVSSSHNVPENIFNFNFNPVPPTPCSPLFTMAPFPFPAPPTSPTPVGGSNTGTLQVADRTDVFRSFGLPNPRPRNAVAGLGETQRVASDGSATGAPSSTPSDTIVPNRTMYGTEFDSNSRFSDFGDTGTSFWAAGR